MHNIRGQRARLPMFCGISGRKCGEKLFCGGIYHKQCTGKTEDHLERQNKSAKGGAYRDIFDRLRKAYGVKLKTSEYAADKKNAYGDGCVSDLSYHCYHCHFLCPLFRFFFGLLLSVFIVTRHLSKKQDSGVICHPLNSTTSSTAGAVPLLLRGEGIVGVRILKQ